MAAAAAMAAASCGGAGAARSLSRFRGCLAGALLGDCVGAIYEAQDTVSLTSVLRHVQSLEPDPGSAGSARTGGRGRALRDSGGGARGGTRGGGSAAGRGRGGRRGSAGRTWARHGPRGHLGLSLARAELRPHASRPNRSRLGRGSTVLRGAPAGTRSRAGPAPTPSRCFLPRPGCPSPLTTPRRVLVPKRRPVAASSREALQWFSVARRIELSPQRARLGSSDTAAPAFWAALLAHLPP